MFNETKIFSIILFCIVWQAISFLVNSELFPSLIDIFYSIVEHFKNKDLIENMSITLYRVVLAFDITMIIGIFLGFLMGISTKIENFFSIFLTIALNIPALVTIVICYIWFGLTDFSLILAVVINKVPIIIVNIKEAVSSLDKKYLQLVKVYNLNFKETLFKIYIPYLYPSLISSSRIAISLIWKLVLVVELLGRSDGVGFQISMFFQYFDITSIFAYTFCFIFIIFLFERFFLTPMEKKYRRWI